MAQIHKEIADDFNALLKNWIGMLVRCEKETGKAFTAKLISIKGNHLLFEDIHGRILMDSITSLKTAAPIAPFKNAAEEEAELERYIYNSTLEAEKRGKYLPGFEQEAAELEAEQRIDEAAARARKGL